MKSTSEAIRSLFEHRGDSQYGGEAVSQLEHALQAASLGREEGADESLIVAALLHDVGHLLHGLPDDAPENNIDDLHEDRAAVWLEKHFGPAVTEPVRMHVAAKRYLCAVDSHYMGQLSQPSVISLRLQGGPMSAAEIAQFQGTPFHEGAIRLRRWDDAAKVPGLATPSLEDCLEMLDRVAKNFPPVSQPVAEKEPT